MLLRHHSCPLYVQRATNRAIRPVLHDQIRPEHTQASCQRGSVRPDGECEGQQMRVARRLAYRLLVCVCVYGSERLLMHCGRLKLRQSYESTHGNALLSACASVTLMPSRSFVFKLFYRRLQMDFKTFWNEYMKSRNKADLSKFVDSDSATHCPSAF